MADGLTAKALLALPRPLRPLAGTVVQPRCAMVGKMRADEKRWRLQWLQKRGCAMGAVGVKTGRDLNVLSAVMIDAGGMRQRPAARRTGRSRARLITPTSLRVNSMLSLLRQSLRVARPHTTRAIALRSSTAVETPAAAAAAAAVETPVKSPEAPAPSSGNSFRSRFTWFLSGVAITAIAFSFILREDTLKTSAQLRKTIDGSYFSFVGFCCPMQLRLSNLFHCKLSVLFELPRFFNSALHSDVINQENETKSRLKSLEKAVADMQKGSGKK